MLEFVKKYFFGAPDNKIAQKIYRFMPLQDRNVGVDPVEGEGGVKMTRLHIVEFFCKQEIAYQDALTLQARVQQRVDDSERKAIEELRTPPSVRSESSSSDDDAGDGELFERFCVE